MDGETSLELSDVRTVEQMPISRSCIARKEDIKSWPHLVDVLITELEVDEITLIIGLQEKPTISFKTNWDTYSLCIISCLGQFLSHISPLPGPLPDQCCCAVCRNCSSFK